MNTASAASSRPPRILADRDSGHAACPTGWTSAPNASWSAACYGVIEHASSLRGCMEACGQHRAVPACIGSEEENGFAAALLGRGDWAWRLGASRRRGGAPWRDSLTGAMARGARRWARAAAK